MSRYTTDPDVVSLASERESTERVHAFHDSHEFKAGTKAAGILEMERMFLLEEVDGGMLRSNMLLLNACIESCGVLP